MKFEEITIDSKVYPGEYLLHDPSQAIVLCGAYMKAEGKIRALRHGRMMEDKITHFRKIQLNQVERKQRVVKRCGGCKSQ
jgi:hypothetical protein